LERREHILKTAFKLYRVLTAENPDPEKVRELFADKDDPHLIDALAHPQHSAAAKAVLGDIARERGLETGEDRLWAQDEAILYVPPFGERPAFEEALEAPIRWRRIHRVAKALAPALLVLGIWALIESSLARERAYQQAPRQANASRGHIPNAGGGFSFIGYVFIVGAPLVWLETGRVLWRSPRRILLLRPFQAKKLARPLRRFAKRNLSFTGLTFTLSDRYVKESRLEHILNMIPLSLSELVLLPLSFIPYFRQMKRYLYVKSGRSWNFLKRRLKQRTTLIHFWRASRQKPLSTRCSDTWWKSVVDLLMYSCEIIVVDLSWVKSGTEWELDKIDARDLEGKTVFVVSEPKHEHALEVVRHFWPGPEAPPPLFVFDNKGRVSDAEGLQKELARIVSDSHLWEEPN
jgi:hypothetical protein